MFPFLFYSLYLCITALAIIYFIYTSPAHFGVFPSCIISPLFTVIIPNWRSASLARVCIISYLFSLPLLLQISAKLWRWWGVFILLHLPMQILWHHNCPPLFFMIVGPFSTTPPIIVHEIHTFIPQRIFPHRKIKFKRFEKWLGEVMFPVHNEARTGYLNPNINFREHRESAGKHLAQE